MAIKLSDQYPGRANPPSVDYPNGSVKNRSAPGVLDGTPLDEAWANDKEGFFQSILAARGITANGEVDKVGASQYYDALAADPTETERGLPLVATQSEAEGWISNSKMLTPFGLSRAFSGNALKTTSGYQKLPGGLILQWISKPNLVQTTTMSFPMAFPNQVLALVGTHQTGVGVQVGLLGAWVISNAQFGWRMQNASNNSDIFGYALFIAIGY